MQIDNLLPFAFYQRISQREKRLLLLVLGTAFILGNLLALTTIARSFRTLRQDYRDKNDEWKFASNFIQDKATWDTRAEWLRKTQPKMTSRDSVSYALLDQVQGLGRQYKVIITNSKIRPVSPGDKVSPDYQAVTMEIDTRSDWGDLVRFMNALQQKPENFLAFDEARLHSEPSDPATMIGNFRLSKWFAPAGGK